MIEQNTEIQPIRRAVQSLATSIREVVVAARSEGMQVGMRRFGGLLCRLIRFRQHFLLYEMRLPTSHSVVEVAPELLRSRTSALHFSFTLADYEELAHRSHDFGSDARARPYDGSAMDGTVVFWTVLQDGTFVNQTGMTLQLDGSVYASLHRRREAPDDSRAYAGYSETAANLRRKGVYTMVHSRIYDVLHERGIRSVVLLEGDDQPGPKSAQVRLGARVIADVTLTRWLGSLNRWVLRWTPSLGQ